MTKKKYIVYKTSGGLNHMLNQINIAIHISKISNRFLIIDCLDNAFKNDFNTYFNIPDFDYSTNYTCLYEDDEIKKEMFEPYINIGVKYNNGYYFLNDKITNSTIENLLSNNDSIVYFTYMKDIIPNMPWYIKVNKDIIEKISDNKINDKYIGVHYRNTDTKNDITYFVEKIKKLSDLCNIIYLGTDDYSALERLNNLLESNFKIIQYTKPINLNGSNIHYGNPNKDVIIMNSLIDMFHLTYSTFFIPSLNSSFSTRIMKLRNKDNFFK